MGASTTFYFTSKLFYIILAKGATHARKNPPLTQQFCHVSGEFCIVQRGMTALQNDTDEAGAALVDD
ncbi:MAG: hypothetical protein RSA17_00760, partial [Ruthenibacterium sp.]